jgi:cobalt-zinc-cadmium efflux system protein
MADHTQETGHAHVYATSERSVGLAAVLTGLFLSVEVVGGLVSGSLALLADAGHMLTDFAGLGLAWFGFRLGRRPADWKLTYGFQRFSILAAFVNGLALFVIAAWIVFEAAQRFMHPTPVLGGMMLWIALAGLAVNVAGFWVLRGGDARNLNVRAATLHVIGDMLGSLAVLLAALVIVGTGWTPIDPLLSVVVALIILRSGWRVVRDSGHILIEGAPSHLDTRAIADDLRRSVPGIADVHHVHAWSITEERPIITLHARVSAGHQPEGIVAAIKARLKERFAVEHATVEVEMGGCADERGAPPEGAS